MSHSEICLARIAVLEAFDDLNDLTRVFRAAFRETAEWPAQLDPDLVTDNPRDAAIELWTDYYFHDEQEATDTRRALGLISIPASVGAAAEALNEAKHRFKTAVGRLRKLSESETRKTLRDVVENHQRDPEVGRLFARQLCARIHLLQAYRKLVILPEDVTKVAFTHTKGVVRRRLTPTETEQRLIEYFGPGSQAQIAALARLSPDTTPVETRPGAEHWRANVWTGDRRRQVKASMPLLVVRPDPNAPLPKHNLLDLNKPPPARRPRKDRRTEPAPLAPGLRIHLVRQP